VEEAVRLVEGTEDRPDAVRALAAVHLARGDTAIASALLLRRLGEVSEGSLAVPLLALLVEVQLAQGDATAAGTTTARLRAIADRAAWERTEVLALLAEGRVATAEGEVSRARDRLTSAITIADRLHMPLEAARARLVLAEALAGTEPELARHEAGVAFETFDEAGATALADRAASVVRGLGGPARTGPKSLGLLTKREVEVLALLGEGLTNAEIAARLFISTKTVEHHVSNVLGKLHLENRAQAAAIAQRHLDRISGQI
jgi:DNA-binding CsgD family transcriptional regulator